MARRRSAYKEKNRLSEGGAMKWVIVPACLIFIMSGLYYIWYMSNQNATYNNIEYIRSFMSSNGKLNDFQNKIGCKDKDDIKWFLTEDEVRIEYGKMILTWEPKDFVTQENQDLLSTIGISMEYNKKNKEFKLYWNGEELERWVK